MAESSLYDVTNRLVGYLKHRATPGVRAQLRRALSSGLEFYRLAAELLPPNWERNADTWRALVSAIASLDTSLHQPRKPLGVALAVTGFSEFRLNRLLATPADLRIAAVQSAARYLAKSSVPFDFSELVRFALTQDTAKRDELNLEIATAFLNHHAK